MKICLLVTAYVLVTGAATVALAPTLLSDLAAVSNPAPVLQPENLEPITLVKPTPAVVPLDPATEQAFKEAEQ